jgi:Tol biopolymer transport system component
VSPLSAPATKPPGSSVYAATFTVTPVADGGPRGSVSPDGSEIAFASDADGDFDVYVLTRATGAIRQLTTDAGSDGQPVFSPDGSRIAFSTRRDGNWEIYIMNAADGSAPTNLTNSAASDDFEPDWK